MNQDERNLRNQSSCLSQDYRVPAKPLVIWRLWPQRRSDCKERGIGVIGHLIHCKETQKIRQFLSKLSPNFHQTGYILADSDRHLWTLASGNLTYLSVFIMYIFSHIISHYDSPSYIREDKVVSPGHRHQGQTARARTGRRQLPG